MLVVALLFAATPTVTFRLMVAVVPAVTVPSVQVTVPDEPDGTNPQAPGSVPPVGVMPAGRGSVITTLAASLGPLFVTPSAYTNVSPTDEGVGDLGAAHTQEGDLAHR